MPKELKKCPFCGSGLLMICNEIEKDFEKLSSWIVCNNCMVSTKAFIDEEMLIRFWNTRALEKNQSVRYGAGPCCEWMNK